MIVYQARKAEFLRHVQRDDIEAIVERQFRGATGHGTSPGELRAWRESLFEMSKVLDDAEGVIGDRVGGFFRVRFTGLSAEDAREACKALTAKRQTCMVIAPGR